MTPRIPCTIFQPVVETGMAMNSSTPAMIATIPNRIATDAALVMSKRKMTSENTSHAMPPSKNSHHHRAASRATSRSSNMLSRVDIPTSSSRIQRAFLCDGRHSCSPGYHLATLADDAGL